MNILTVSPTQNGCLPNLDRLRHFTLFRRWLIRIFTRLLRASAIRLVEDLELMQALHAGINSAAFASSTLTSAGIVPNRDALLLKSLAHALVDGLVCEFGVYKGHTLKLIAEARKEAPVYGFDSFEGLPETWRAGFAKGRFKVAKDSLPTFSANVRLFPGLFTESIPLMLEEDNRPAVFLHVDCDLYTSTRCVFEALAPRLRPGTVIVFDEYFNFPGWEQHEHKALIEASHEGGFNFDYLYYNPQGQQVSIVVTAVNVENPSSSQKPAAS